MPVIKFRDQEIEIDEQSDEVKQAFRNADHMLERLLSAQREYMAADYAHKYATGILAEKLAKVAEASDAEREVA